MISIFCKLFFYVTLASKVCGKVHLSQILAGSVDNYGALFGARVAISGSDIIVTAYRDDETNTNAGKAYFFQLNQTSSKWILTQEIVYPTQNTGFGWSLAMATLTDVTDHDQDFSHRYRYAVIGTIWGGSYSYAFIYGKKYNK